MPTYNFRCLNKKCGKEYEELRPISKYEEELCIDCGSETETFITEVCAVHFKGGGWAGNSEEKSKKWLNKYEQELIDTKEL